MTTDPKQAAATRQAAAFLLHAGNQNQAGMNAVLDELNQDPEMSSRFVFGMASVFHTLMPVLYSNAGQWLMQQTVADLAGLEHGDVQ